jgi:hypothetical protein
MMINDDRMSDTLSAAHRRRIGAKQLLRVALAGAGAAALVAVTASPSHAAAPVAFVTAGNDVHYVGNDIQNRVTVTSDFSGAVLLREPISGITPGPGCTRVVTGGVKCVALPGEAKVDFIKLELAGGSDEATVQTSINTRVEGGPGEFDKYFGATTSTGTNVVFDGGPGRHDRADYGFSKSGVLVALGTAAGDTPLDGRLNVDNDNITSTVEDLLGSDHDDSLRGNEGSNLVDGRLGADALRGGPGDDEIWAWETNAGGSEADKADLSCGKGFDVIIVDQVDPGTSECESIRRVS